MERFPESDSPVQLRHWEILRSISLLAPGTYTCITSKITCKQRVVLFVILHKQINVFIIEIGGGWVGQKSLEKKF